MLAQSSFVLLTYQNVLYRIFESRLSLISVDLNQDFKVSAIIGKSRNLLCLWEKVGIMTSLSSLWQ